MPNRTHLVEVARELKKRLNGKAFLTIERTDITELIRARSDEPKTRMKSTIASQLEDALVTQGVQVYPSLTETTTGDTVRIYHAGSVLGQLIDTIVHPDQGTDGDLGEVILKVKGHWNWATHGDPTA